ncbi:MAG TPA: hypothetical protein VKZ41_05930 [Gemmatimonadales bacterium]|nr:hypothetical protein [Gemmatimonadales bacterium]
MAPDFPRIFLRLRRLVTEAFTERLAYKLAALLVAFVLWLTLRAENPMDGDVPVRLELALDSSLSLLGPSPSITAYVVGSSRALNRLAFDPPVVRRTFGADTPDSVEVELTNEDVLMPPGVNATVRSVQPRRVLLRFVPSMTRRVPVISSLTFRPATGVRITGAAVFAPDSVTVTGSRRVVLALSGVPTIDTTLVVRSGDPLLIPLDTGAVAVSVSPGYVRLQVPVELDSTANFFQLFLPFRTR